MRPRRASLLALGALLAGCSEPPTCGDLSGLWRDGAGRRYHVVDAAGAVEIYALDDSRGGLDRPMPGARRSASYARLERRDGAIAGHGQQFRAEGDRVCRVRWAIQASCGDRALTLEIEEPGALDASDCSQAAGGAERSVSLRPIDAL